MSEFYPFRFQIVRLSLTSFVLAFFIFNCQKLWASQSAIVVADQAIVYADQQMSAPLGFVTKGKKVKVGDIARNRSQVYPIIVNGKVGYIRLVDVTTQRESATSKTLVAERFQKLTTPALSTNYAVSFFNYATLINLNIQNDKLKDKDQVNWFGVGISGGAVISPKWDLNLLLNMMTAEAQDESFRMVEFGIGGALKIIDSGRFKLRFLVQALAVPYASYAFKEDFRVNGYGFSTGGALNMSYRMGPHWGMEAYGGLYFTKISKFSPPSPYNEISPSFVGSRIGLGMNYEF